MAINNGRGDGLDWVLKRLNGEGMDVSLPESRCNPWNGHLLACTCGECNRERAWYAEAAAAQARAAATKRLWEPGALYKPPEQISWEERAVADIMKEADEGGLTSTLAQTCMCRYCTKLRAEEVVRASDAPAVVESTIEISCPTCRRDFGSFRLKAVGVDPSAFVEITPVCQGCAAEGR